MKNISKIASEIFSSLNPLIERHDYGERGLDQIERAAIELKKRKMLPERLENQIEEREKKLRKLVKEKEDMPTKPEEKLEIS
jgi:hypothetical protein